MVGCSAPALFKYPIHKMAVKRMFNGHLHYKSNFTGSVFYIKPKVGIGILVY